MSDCGVHVSVNTCTLCSRKKCLLNVENAQVETSSIEFLLESQNSVSITI